MLFKKGANGFLFAVAVLFCFVVPSRVNGMNSSDDIFYDTLLKPMLKKTLAHVKMNTNKHGFFHQYDFSTFSFSVPFIYRLMSVDNIASFIQGLMYWRGHEKKLKSFFNKDSSSEYGSFSDVAMRYKFLEKYKNLTYSVSRSSCTTFLYSWYIQLRESNFFASYGLLYEYSKHIYSFNYDTFKYSEEMFNEMKEAYSLEGEDFIGRVDKIIQGKYPKLKKNNIDILNNLNAQQVDDKVEPNLNIRYDSIVEKYAKQYITAKERRQNIRTFSDIYKQLEKNDEKKAFEKDLKSKYIDYNARNNWEQANKSVSFCVNDFGAHVGISYLQNKIDPFYGFYFSMSLAAGIQYITCVNGMKIYDKESTDEYNSKVLLEVDNNCFAFLRNQNFYRGLFSFFIKFRLEAGYGLLRFFISLKSLDLQEIKKVLEPETKFELGEGDSAVRIEEYNEACYGTSKSLFANFKIKEEEGFKRFLPKIIQFGFTLNL